MVSAAEPPALLEVPGLPSLDPEFFLAERFWPKSVTAFLIIFKENFFLIYFSSPVFGVDGAIGGLSGFFYFPSA